MNVIFSPPPEFSSLRRRFGRPPALFLDFDGTLVPIAPRPEQAGFPPGTRRLLDRLSMEIPVAVVSGRSLKDIRFRVGLKGLVYVGNHGLEISGRGLRYRMPNEREWRRFLGGLAAGIRDEVCVLPGIVFENKGFSLSIHYRLAGGSVRRQLARRIARRLNPLAHEGKIRIRRGKAVWEIRPPISWDKGRAVEWILDQPRFRNRWPLYIGDDETDQDAFRRVRRIGLGIAVGPWSRKGSAHCVLKDPGEVLQFLRTLLDDFQK